MHVIRADEKLAAGMQPLSAHDEPDPRAGQGAAGAQEEAQRELADARSGRLEVAPERRAPPPGSARTR